MFAVGVDVSNGRSMVAVLGARRSVVVQPHEVPHTADGFAELAARLHALDGEVRIVMEHTGRYYESFAMSMYRAGFFVSAVNPLATKGYQEGISVRKVKTDKADALKIAQFAIDKWEILPHYTPMDTIRYDLKTLHRQFQLSSKTKTALNNNLIALLEQSYHPSLGYLVVVGSGVDTQEAAAHRKPLVIQGEPDLYTSQYNLEMESQVRYAFEYAPDSTVLAQSMLVQDGSVDLYRLRYDGSVRRLIERGYYTPLQNENALAEQATLLRPFFRTTVYQGEDLACFPLQLSLHGPAYDPTLVTGMVPDTWEDWLRYLIRMVQADPDGNQPLFEGNYSSSYLRDTLIDLLIEQYRLACDSVGEKVAMENLRLNLSLTMELCEIIPESAFSDDSPLFRMRYVYVAAALKEDLSPLLLAFVPDTPPQRTPVLDVYLLNPYGEHRETALDYLTYVAQSQSGWLYTSLYQADETVEQADYRLRLERLEKQAAELTQMLTTAAPEDIRAIQDQLDAVELQRQVLEEKRWEVNEAALKRYHQVLDTLAFPAAELPQTFYADILYNLKACRMDVDSFCRELAHMQSMWHSENDEE